MLHTHTHKKIIIYFKNIINLISYYHIYNYYTISLPTTKYHKPQSLTNFLNFNLKKNLQMIVPSKNLFTIFFNMVYSVFLIRKPFFSLIYCKSCAPCNTFIFRLLGQIHRSWRYMFFERITACKYYNNYRPFFLQLGFWKLYSSSCIL